jgi:hypothetical protein
MIIAGFTQCRVGVGDVDDVLSIHLGDHRDRGVGVTRAATCWVYNAKLPQCTATAGRTWRLTVPL